MISVLSITAFKAVQRARNPPGPWNNHGSGTLASQCISHAKLVLPFLHHPLAYMLPVQNLVVSEALSVLETPIQFHVMSTVHIAQWNVVATYHRTAIPVYDIGVNRRPSGEASSKNINIALLYCTLRVIESVFPATSPARDAVKDVMRLMWLDPDDRTTDTTTPVGIGNVIAAAALRRHWTDGYNSLGDIDQAVNRQIYAMYNMFVPNNTAYELKHLSKWQPLLETNGQGYFTVQQHITPQAGQVIPSLITQQDVATSLLDDPYKEPLDLEAYRTQALAVLNVSAALTDRQKMLAEYFDDKWTSLAAMSLAISTAMKYDATQHAGADLHVPCLADGVIVAWKEKIRLNAVRPISAIQHLFQDQEVEGWVQFQGTQKMKGREWLSYLRTMPHADFPSGTSCVCAIYGEYHRALLGSDRFPTDLIGPTMFKKGCSRREPGVTPTEDLSVTWKTWDDFIRECAQSRLYAGVHFQPAIDAGIKLCTPIGKKCFARYQSLLQGKTG